MAWKLEGTYFETCTREVVCPCTASLSLGAHHDRCRVARATRSRIDAFGIEYEEKAGFSTSRFAPGRLT